MLLALTTASALTESLRRGGDAARASANKDGDLASVRTFPWFAELLAEPTEAPSKHPADLAEEEDDDMKPPPNCPPEVKYDDDHYCLFDMLAEWKFEELVFSTPVSIDLEIPERPAKKRWKKASKIPWSSLRGSRASCNSPAPTNGPMLKRVLSGPRRVGRIAARGVESPR